MIGMDDDLRAVEAALFAAEEPMTVEEIAAHVGVHVEVAAALAELPPRPREAATLTWRC